ncbi:MAG: carboxypeptidase regulatory-like domain-containing protein, partial [Pedobacter sp.]
MKPNYFLLTVFLILTSPIYGQTSRQVSGVVKDSTGAAIPMATIKLLSVTDSSTIIANTEGRFIFSSITATQFTLVFSSLGYLPLTRQYTLITGSRTVELDPVILKSDTIALKGVIVTNVPVRIKEDTIEYDALAYKTRLGATLEDMLKKLPGLEVAKDGSISAQGKQVSKVQLNGKDFVSGDIKSLTRNLPSDLVHSVQVIDDYGEQAKLTGIKNGESQKILNISIRKDKNHGYFVQGRIGGGFDAFPPTKAADRDGRYATSASFFNFQDKRQITVTGEINNTNTSLFDINGGRKGPDPFGDKQNGIVTTRAVGLNYRDDWGKKLTVYGSYSLAGNLVFTNSSMIRDNLSVQSPSNQKLASTRNDHNVNHQINFNIEYRPDTMNFFKIIPVFSYGGVRSDENFRGLVQAGNSSRTLISEYSSYIYAKSSTPNFGMNVLYNHKFYKRGRNFNALLTGGRGTNEQFENPTYHYLVGRTGAPINQLINSNSCKDSISTSFSYLEPLGKRSYFEFRYNYHNALTTAMRMTDTV